MENLKIDRTEKTPEVNANVATGMVMLKGKCIPENTLKFFEVITNWVNEYLVAPQPESRLVLRLEYFNTSSAKKILDTIRLMQNANDTAKTNAKVIWQYEEGDTDMLEAGEDIKELVHIPFDFEEVPEE